MQQYLEMGKVVSTHGIKGEVRVLPWCDGPEEFIGIERLYAGKEYAPLTVEKARTHGNMAILKFVGADSIEAAERLRGTVLYAHRADLTLEPGQYFIADLIGLQVVDADSGAAYGALSDVSKTGANDVYHIRFADGKERLIPAIPEVVASVDLEKGVMEIRPLKGLFDDED